MNAEGTELVIFIEEIGEYKLSVDNNEKIVYLFSPV